ncbi:MAG: creatininase family protein [bacterium]
MTHHPPPPLLDRPHCEARDALASGAPVYLPVNPVEFHGPHLSLHNDRLVAAGLIQDLHTRLAETHADWPLLRAADLEVGVDVVLGPGARPVPYEVAARLIRGACTSLAELGARRVVLMTFHGSPFHSHALEEGVRVLRARGVQAVNPMNELLRAVIQGELQGERTRLESALPDASPELRAALEQSLVFDFHAGLLETSLALHYAPETVHPCHRELPACPPLTPVRAIRAVSRAAAALGRRALARELEFAALGLAWHALRPFPGYTGSPHLATAKLGALFATPLVERLTRVVEDVFDGRAPSPAPLMGWLGPLSLGGRLGTSVFSAAPTT